MKKYKLCTECDFYIDCEIACEHALIHENIDKTGERIPSHEEYDKKGKQIKR